MSVLFWCSFGGRVFSWKTLLYTNLFFHTTQWTVLACILGCIKSRQCSYSSGNYPEGLGDLDSSKNWHCPQRKDNSGFRRKLKLPHPGEGLSLRALPWSFTYLTCSHLNMQDSQMGLRVFHPGNLHSASLKQQHSECSSKTVIFLIQQSAIFLPSNDLQLRNLQVFLQCLLVVRIIQLLFYSFNLFCHSLKVEEGFPTLLWSPQEKQL